MTRTAAARRFFAPLPLFDGEPEDRGANDLAPASSTRSASAVHGPLHPGLAADSEKCLADIRAFGAFGAPTQAVTEGAIPYLVNEFWTAGQRRAHPIHEVSYRA